MLTVEAGTIVDSVIAALKGFVSGSHATGSLDSRSTIARRLIAPVVGILGVSCAIVVALVIIAGRAQDGVAIKSSVHLAKSSLSVIERDLGRIAKDVSWWDEAFHRLIESRDLAWAEDNFGSYVAENFGISAAFVIGPGDTEFLGFVGGKPVGDALNPFTTYSGGLGQIVNRAREGPMNEPEPVTGLLRMGEHVHIVATSAITPEDPPEAQLAPAPRAVLVISRALDTEFLNQVSGELLLNNLRLSSDEKPPGTASLALFSVNGRDLGSLTWRLDLPGRTLLFTTLPALAGAFLAMGALLWWFLRRAQHAALQIHDAAQKLKIQNVELAHGESRLRAIMENVAEGIITVDSDGRIESVNPAAERVFGLIASEAVGRSFEMILAEPGAPDAIRQHLERADGGRAILLNEMIGRRKDGSTFPMDIAVGEARIGDQRMMTAVVRDATFRKAAEEALRAAKEGAEKASETKTEFLAHVSHELRTPLNAIIGFSDMFRTETLGPLGSAKYLEYADYIQVSGQHLLALINDILDFSKAEAGKLDLSDGEVCITHAIEVCVQMVKTTADEQGVVISRDIETGLPHLMADERRIWQILLNLLSNAVKFNCAEGQIKVHAIVGADDAIRITVSDTGVGMAKDDIIKALTPFVQLDLTMIRRHDGSGLGLSLTQHLVELHGGELRIDSEPGVGTTAVVRFPPERTVPLPMA